MASIAWTSLDRRDSAPDPWPSAAATIVRSAGWLGVSLRDCVVLVPFAQLLPLAQRAFAERGGWMPRIETTHTLAASLGPQGHAGPGELSFDLGVDALNAEALLRRQPWGRAWARRHPQAFRRAAVHLAQAAQAFARAAHGMAPQARKAWLARGRDLLAPADGLGARERALARIGLEWAALAEAPATDRLFGLQPAAWFGVSAGGKDPLLLNLFEAAPAHIACEVIDLDAGLGEGCALPRPAQAPTRVICEDFEDEANCAAAQVLEHLAHGRRPVALIAQDRILVRRVRALLERESVSIRDETGWKLSTTRAAGRVMALLQAAAPDASSDALLDWLKSGPRWVEFDADAAQA
jgi:ATP-dependent helicase/nuclease subunit B